MKIKSLIIAFLYLGFWPLFAQVPDTVRVPVTIDGNPLGSINKFIQGDTTSSGERVNPLRVYQLQRGQIYFLDEAILAEGYHLQIAGEEEDPDNPLKPATIAPGIRADGSFTNRIIFSRGDLTLKNIYFMAKPPNAFDDIYPAIQKGIMFLQDQSKLTLDGCYFEWIRLNVLDINANFCDVIIKNCVFRNLQNIAGEWGGVVYRSNSPADSVIFLNNTIVNCNSQFFAVRNFVNYWHMEHNTFVNMLNMVIGWPFFAPVCICSNNIFYNMNAMGQDAVDLQMYDQDNLLWSTINVDTIYSNILPYLGISEQDRIIDVNNNCYYHDSRVVDYWNSIDSVMAVPWMNDRTRAMFDDDESYPYLTATNNLNIDPQFVRPPENIDTMIEWCNLYRSQGGSPEFHWGWDPDEDYFNVEWPLPEDLSYPQACLLYTGGSDGFPVGDLNWFPDKKTEWLSQQTTLVTDERRVVDMVNDYELYPNYPNPFNPETMISYHLKTNKSIHLAVYNALGQCVKELASGHQSAGHYQILWNGTNGQGNPMSSGIYYVRLVTDRYESVKKMALVR